MGCVGWPSARSGQPDCSAWPPGRHSTQAAAPRPPAPSPCTSSHTPPLEKSGLAFLRNYTGDWPESLPGSEHGEVEYELTRAEWERP